MTGETRGTAAGQPVPTLDGMIVLASGYVFNETADRLVAAVCARGMIVFARIDHGAGAKSAGLALRPTELLIFGSAGAGTLLMQQTQMIGIDLPLKALVWQDEQGAVWLGYNDPDWLAGRYKLAAEGTPVLRAMAELLGASAREATATTTGDSQ